MHAMTTTVSSALLDSAALRAAASIKRSWERCAAIDYSLHTDPNPMSASELQARREQHAHVLEATQPELESLAALVSSAKSVVLLADAGGVILQEAGSTEFLHKAERVALRPGVSWAESLRGTNAIGTALYEGTAIRVHGVEHFLDCNAILSCHAAPIFSPRGDVIGVLDISGEANTLHAYALGLAQMCAKQIGNRLLDNTDARLHRLVFQQQPSLLESAERAILLVEGERIVGANDAALRLLAADWSLLDSPVDDWLDGWQALKREPGRLRTQSGMPLLGTLRHGTSRGELPNPDSRPAPQKTPAAPAAVSRIALPQLSPETDKSLAHAISALNAGMAVLLQGETGAGKEIFARHLHDRSDWRHGPFVAVNCGALPESLIESELFGYEAGAFTGARREGALGRLREAHGGILFLDEIGDMPLLLQTRLLRALQEREVQPLGSDRRIPVNFGVVSATNRDLADMIGHGAFRADLFYRLQDYKTTLPPLRQRADLRELLCHEFKRLGALERATTLGDAALDALAAYPWPGNYREMQSVLRTLLFLRPAGRLIQRCDLPADILPRTRNADALAAAPPDTAAATASAGPAPGTTLRAINEQAILRVIAQCGNNVSQAAGILGVHRSTLYRYLARSAAPKKKQRP